MPISVRGRVFLSVSLLLLPLSVTASAESLLPVPAALPQADQSGLAPVGDIQMYYAIYNSAGADTVIMLHGGLGSANNWGDQVPALVGKHRVVLAESRGHGRSSRGTKPMSFGQMAADVVGLMDFLKIDKAAIVGWSDGGIIGLDIAIHQPERVTRLYAYGANFNVAGVNPDAANLIDLNAVMGELGAEYERLSPTPENFEAFAGEMFQLWSAEPNYTAEELASISVPVDIVAGEHEEFVLPEHTKELAHLIPGAELEILPAVGHFGLWERPDQFNQSLGAFLDGG